ncbi:hypothetical protein QYH60_13960 (plasmid) [Lactococcus lactis subsp. lactis]|uniref:hypothetical protein n=1 Tax=Lactococcus lactis TaxID=1358 RepID=UPI00264736E1|nr:hypothetical protein [Lactococcus lactis]WKB49999.1 hypothetical protein QYH60_13960 [Lactococcus lactis subsp. lactis]
MAIKKIVNISFVITALGFSFFTFFTSDQKFLIVKSFLALLLMVLGVICYRVKSEK